MAVPKKDHEYTPEELNESLSTYDPKAVGDQGQGGKPQPATPGKAGPPPENTAEQARRDEKASTFQNNPEQDREDHLTRIGRGQQTHG